MNDYTVKDLKSICKALGLKGYSKFRKKELIEFIEKSQNPEKEIEINEEDIDNIEDECSICLCEKVNEIILNCSHSFCKDCISAWEKTNSSCPLCRKKITKKRKKNKKIKKVEPYVKVIDINDYLSEEDFVNYMRNLNLII